MAIDRQAPTIMRRARVAHPGWQRVGVAVGGLLLALVSACGTTGPVGLTPSQTPSVETPSASAAVDSFQLDIFIDAESVTPVNRDFRLDVGQPVMLVARSDHDVSVQISGPEIDRSVFVARKATIPIAFVVDRPGTVTITTDDPQATIATLTIA